jgi:flavin reductase (DIM6/NTAB) family NADH-FMN oxidoreductase RutF
MQHAETLHQLDPQLYKSGMRRLAGAVCILTLNRNGDWAGLTATAVSSISAEPPRLMVCINRNVYAHEFVEPGGPLCVNVLESGQLEEAKRFAGMLNGVKGQDRFSAGPWQQSEDDAPELESSLVRFQCRIGEVIMASTHSIVLCDVVGVSTAAQVEPPLIYFNGRFMAVAESLEAN